MSRHRPPQPPDGVYPIDNRLLMPIPSVPQLQSYRDKLLAYTFLRGLHGLDDGWYSVMRDLERAEQALDDARWRLACISWRWLRHDPVWDGEEAYWMRRSRYAAWRFQDELDQSVDFPYAVGKSLALRPKTEVVA